MTRRRWIADEFTAGRASLLGANAAHLARVLRARAGDEHTLVCGNEVRVATIASVSEERVEFILGDLLDEHPERETVLLLAVYKFDHMEWAIEKCVELGATRIVPVIARRTDAHLATACLKRVERWRRIAHEAAQQSRRQQVPVIDEPLKLKAALSLDLPVRLLLNENERAKKISRALPEGNVPVAVAVGPEGGWTDEELSQFAAAGWQSVTLGGTILRAETAAIAALAVLAAEVD
ncbi:MAG: RsmE family RNA methyltransferase [Acidobacteriota bacterium]|nr:RsmE family RNA methyltransferase [Acidobacteriota bacterium]